MSTYYPRFGGYFYKYLTKLPNEEIIIIRQTIYNVYISIVRDDIYFFKVHLLSLQECS